MIPCPRCHTLLESLGQCPACEEAAFQKLQSLVQEKSSPVLSKSVASPHVPSKNNDESVFFSELRFQDLRQRVNFLEEEFEKVSEKAGELSLLEAKTLQEIQLKAMTQGPALNQEVQSQLQSLESQLKGLETQTDETFLVFREQSKTLAMHFESVLRDLESQTKHSWDAMTGGILAQVEELKLRLVELNSQTDALFETIQTQIQERLVTLESQLKDLNAALETKADKSVCEEQSKNLASRFESFMNDLDLKTNQSIENLSGNMAEKVQEMKAQLEALKGKSDSSLEVLRAEIHEDVIRLESQLKKMDTKAEQSAVEEEVTSLQDRLEKLRNDVNGYVAERIQEMKSGLENLEARVAGKVQEMKTRLENLDGKTDSSFEVIRAEIQKSVNQLELELKGLDTKADQAALEKEAQTLAARLDKLVNDLDAKTIQSLSSVEEKIQFRVTKLNKHIEDLQEKNRTATEEWRMSAEKRLAAMRTHGMDWIKRLVAGFLIFGAIVGIALFIYGIITTRVSIAEKLAQPEVEKDLVELAQNQVTPLVRASAKSRMEEMQKEMSQKVNSLDTYLQESKENYEEAVLTLALEKSLLKERNQVMSLEDKAIQDGSREAYEELLQLSKSSKSSGEIAQSAAASLTRIRAFYETGRVKDSSIALGQLEGDCRSDPKRVSSLIAHLRNHPDWKMRVYAAEALVVCKNGQVVEALLEAARRDPRLDVVRKALQSFDAMTGYRNPDTFGVNSAEMAWREKRPQFSLQ